MLLAYAAPRESYGLSPRVRGNRANTLDVQTPAESYGSIPARTGEPGIRRWTRFTGPLWSIPARTGEPASYALSMLSCRVYPRAYGGTRQSARSFGRPSGLSPRVRGNLIWARVRRSWARSIPARTGEPHLGACAAILGQVYPPRVRGNHRVIPFEYAVGRSIPARTGEPILPFGVRLYVKVYPRAYGGTGAATTNTLHW